MEPAVTEGLGGSMGWLPMGSARRLNPLILDWGSGSKLSLDGTFLHSL